VIAFRWKVSREGFGGKYHSYRGMGVRLEGFYLYIFEIGSYGEGGVAGQGPRCSRPSQEVQVRVVLTTELHGEGRVAYKAIGPRQVEFMLAKGRPRRRRIWLNGIISIQQPPFIKRL